jgi:thioredoxin-related protein
VIGRPYQFLFVGLVAVLVGCNKGNESPPLAPTPAADSIVWVSSSTIFDTTMIKRDHSVVFFLTDWCHWCTKLKNEVLTDQEVIGILATFYNAVKVNPDIDSLVAYRDTMISCRSFAGECGVAGYPYAVVFDRHGTIKGRIVGYADAAYYAHLLDSLGRLPL